MIRQMAQDIEQLKSEGAEKNVKCEKLAEDNVKKDHEIERFQHAFVEVQKERDDAIASRILTESLYNPKPRP
jgi:hypothetical protein